jgi:adenosylhomocysteine nucleosidase
MTMPKMAIVAALEREVAGFTRSCRRVERQYEGRSFGFFEQGEIVVVCGGIGLEPARRAAQAVFALYQPARLHSVGFAGALQAGMHVGDIFSPAMLIDARDGSRIPLEGGNGALVTFMGVADARQKSKLAEAYQAQAVDMEAAAVADVARGHGVTFGATKVISDELECEMPDMARFIAADGQFKTASFAMFATLRPWMWKPVARLARNSRRAERALSSRLERFLEDMPAATNPSGVSTARAVQSGARE